MKKLSNSFFLFILIISLFVSSLCFFNIGLVEAAYSGTNLDPLDVGWQTFSNIVWDVSVVREGSGSLRFDSAWVDGENINPAWEAYNDFYEAQPGDHIYYEIWIKITDSTLGDNGYAYAGARIGLDLRHNVVGVGRVCLASLEAPTYPDTDQGIQNNYVRWGSTGDVWVKRSIDFVVPSDYFTYDLYTGTTISAKQINEVAPWLQIWSSLHGNTDGGHAWFADKIFYINPTSTPSTPTPPPVPTPSPVPLYSVNFNFKNIDNTAFSSGVTWQLYNGVSPVTYTAGTQSLVSGSYTLWTYYYGNLINTTSFNVPTYQGLPVSVKINLKQGSFFNIVANNTLSSLVINSENATSLSFSATGSNGPYMLVIPTIDEALFLNLNGVAQSYGSGWTYDAVNHCVVITATSLPAS
jgi:hypothetical protein